MMKLTIDGYENILKNKYFYWYKNLIIKRINQPLSEELYGELHHILPKSLGGGNEKENLVILSAREHYIAHLFLVKIINNKDKYKMLCAFNAMNMKSNSTLYRYSNSRLYKHLKEEFALENSKYQKLLWEDPEYKEMMREKAKISWYNGSREAQINYMKNNSPFKIKEIHEKTILTRKINNSNVFVTNNPMKNPELIFKKVQKCKETGYAIGKKVYTNLETGECKYLEKNPGFPWAQQGKSKGKTSKLKGIPQQKIFCEFCNKQLTKQTLKRHKEKYHKNEN